MAIVKGGRLLVMHRRVCSPILLENSRAHSCHSERLLLKRSHFFSAMVIRLYAIEQHP